MRKDKQENTDSYSYAVGDFGGMRCAASIRLCESKSVSLG